MGPPRLRHRLVGEQFALESSHDQRNHCLEQFLNNRSDDGRILNQSVYLSPNWQANTTIVSDKIPGLKTSAVFLSSLRTNLRLHASPPLSPMNTPSSMQASTSSLPPPSPLSASQELPQDGTATDPLDNVPSLQSYVTSNEEEKIAALKLVADSVAQMRQIASRALIFHPLNLGALAAVCAVVAKYQYKAPDDIGIVFSTAVGLIMAYLLIIRWCTGGYLETAESVKMDLLNDADVLVTKFGEEVIGAVVLAWIPADSKGKRRKGWRAEINGWVVRIRYRGKGVGTALLEDAVNEAKKKGVESIEFADDHPNSTRPLWPVYNATFDRNEKKARDQLQRIWDATPKSKKR